MPSRTPTGTLQPTATPTLIDIMHDITVTPGPTATNTPQVCWYYHRITRGETLIGLANHFGVSVATIQSWNGIKNPNIILWGFSLKIQTTCKAATMPPTPSSTPNEQPVSVIEVF
jgi:LysM repeat protein